jgi:tetratricopeptide (TPR) repeat protein
MWSPLCFEATRRIAISAGLFLACCLSAGSAFAHPELLAQIERIDAQLAERPEDTGLMLQRGDLYRRHGDYAAAAADFATVRELDPANVTLGFYEGRLLLEQGDPTRADELLGRYLENEPDHAAAWSLRGQARLARGLPLLAVDDFSAAIEHSTRTTPTLYLQHAAALVAVGEGYWDLARAAADAGLEQHPYDMALLGLATDTALALGQTAIVSGYLERLPGALLGLPQWSSRAESLDCLRRGEKAGRVCADPARERLALSVRDQSQVFRVDSE